MSEKTQPQFTIITVCYNSEVTIRRTFDSVLNQTCADYEYLVVDGLSKDSTVDIIKEYEPKFGGRMRWISERDSGIYNAMNKGIGMASGRIIGIVNSDDWLEKDALENVNLYVAKAAQPYNSIYCGWMNFHYKDGNVQLMKTSAEKQETYYQRVRMGVSHPATMISAEVYCQMGTYDESFRIVADTELITRCYKQGIPFVFIDLAITNMSDGGVSNNLKGIKRKIADFKKLYSKYTTKSQARKYLFVDTLLMVAKAIFPDKLVKKLREKNR